MNLTMQPVLSDHMRRHARTLHRIACGFGRERDADDILQTLYSKFWRRMREEEGWTPPESYVELFVCVKRVAIDLVAKEQRDRAREEKHETAKFTESPEDSLHAFDRLRWILARMPAPLAEALAATLSAGRRNDAMVAEELRITTAAYSARLFKARRAAEELATYYDVLPFEQANLLADVKYSGKSRAQLARERGESLEDLGARWELATSMLEQHRKVAS